MSPFTNTSLRWLPGEPSDSGFCAYLERAQVAGLKANPCTATSDGLICEKPAGEKEWRSRERETARGGCGWRNVKLRWPQFIFGSVKLRSDCLSLSLCPAAQGVHRVRVLVPVRRPALYAPAAPTAPARPWSACGAAARSAASTPRPTSSPSPTDSVWSGRPRTVAVRGGGWKSDGWRVTDMYHTGLRSVNVFSHKCWKSDRTNSLLKVNFLDHFSWSSSGNSFQTLKHKTRIKGFSILSNASNHLNFL